LLAVKEKLRGGKKKELFTELFFCPPPPPPHVNRRGGGKKRKERPRDGTVSKVFLVLVLNGGECQLHRKKL
jgi:hypothetical protein